MEKYREQARNILAANDRGHYTIPTSGLYPFQWNWDSAFAALGFSHVDLDRALVELETLMAHQWPDGMVPHIIFHEHDEGYFPNADVWLTLRPTPTSGITQPAVAGFALWQIVQRAEGQPNLLERCKALVEPIHRWHQWFYRIRGDQDGLVAIVHPWESGRDNSIDWDEAFERVPTEGVSDFKRRDTSHANPEHRPTDEQYKRYIWLVEQFRGLDWDNAAIAQQSKFQVVDPGFNAILIRACTDLAQCAQTLGLELIAQESRALAQLGIKGLDKLWADELDQYLCLDRLTGDLVMSESVGGLLPVFVGIDTDKAERIAQRIQRLKREANYLVPSHSLADPRSEELRYWRAPIWLIINYMIARGLREHGFAAQAEEIDNDSLTLIKESGFAEYYSPIDATPCGGDTFTWTAAIVLELLAHR
jgi:hypothetical protein